MTDITNSGATETDSVYTICDLSGFRAKPGELIPMYPNLMVLPEYWNARNEQEFINGSKAEKQRGPLRPEPVNNPTFIDDPVTVDDL